MNMGLRESRLTPEDMEKRKAYQRANGIGQYNRMVLDNAARKKKIAKKKKKLASKAKKRNK